MNSRLDAIPENEVGLNPFQRKQVKQNTLVVEDKNKFERHRLVQASKRTATAASADEREAKRAAQRAAWVGPGRRDVKTIAGTPATKPEDAEVEATDENVARLMPLEDLKKLVCGQRTYRDPVTHVGRKPQ